MHEAKYFSFCPPGMPLQNNLVPLCRHGDPQRAEVSVLLKLPWLAVDVFADVLGEIPGQLDRRRMVSGPIH